MAMSPRKMMAMSKDLAKAAKMMEGGKVKKMRGGGMAMKRCVAVAWLKK